MKYTYWPTEYGGYRRIPAHPSWTLHKIEIKDNLPSLQSHYELFNEMVRWLYDNIAHPLDKVWYDVDGDRMYFAFSEPAHYTWFLLRWS